MAAGPESEPPTPAAPPGVGFPPEQVARQAQLNASAGLLTGLAYTKTQGRRLEEFVAFAGRQFVAVWGDLSGTGPAAVARAAALQMASLGAPLHALTGDAARAEAVLGPWPPPELVGFAGLSPAECDAVYGLFGLSAARLGLRFVWRREGERVVLEFAR